MRTHRIALVAIVLCIALSGCAGLGGFGGIGGLGGGLSVVAQSQRQWTGVAVSRTGRIFVCYPRWSDDAGVSVAELLPSGEAVPYPDAEWNTWDRSLSPAGHFVCVQSVYADDEDFLWILDPASPKFAGVVEGGAKLVKVDLTTDKVVRRYYFDEYVAPPASYLNDVRIDTANQYAYITDSGAGAIVALNTANGKARRLLEFHSSVKSEGLTITIDGKPWLRPNGRAPEVNADGIALDPANGYLYYQALTGATLYRVQTRLLRDVLVSYKTLGDAVETLGNYGPADGIMFGPDGKLYITAIADNAVKRINAEGIIETVYADRRIAWPDSFALGPDGSMYFTTSQIHLGPNPPEPYRLFRFRP